LVLFYVLLNLAVLAVGVDKVKAWSSELEARLEMEHPWLFQGTREVVASSTTSAPAASPIKTRKKRPRRSKRVKASWSVFFLGTAEEEQVEVDSGAFELDDDSWCEVMSAHAAPENPADHHFIGDATPVTAARQDVYDLGDDVWRLASQV
jgi:hypothetical protein